MKTRVSNFGNRIYDLDGDGLIVLFTRRDSNRKNYHARLRISGLNGCKRVSTGSSDFREAEGIARKYHSILRDSSIGESSLYTKKFSEVFHLFLKTSINESNRGANRSIYALKRYASDFFGRYNISKITAKEVNDFVIWRRLNYVRIIPCDATIKRELSYLRKVFRYAYKKGFIKMLPDFRFENKGRDLPTLPFFSTDEHNRMQDVILSWIREGRHGWRDRYIFSNLIGLSAFSGLKSVELSQLTYDDFFLRDEILCCNIESSRGYRVVEFDSEAKTYVKNLRNLRVEELGSQPPGNEKILYNVRINRAPLNTSQSLISLLGFAKIKIFKNGIKRNVSSFRNLYAYKAIKKGLPDHFIANQLNVSLRTVHDYRMSFSSSAKDEINLEENKSKKSNHSQINWREF